MDVSRALFGGAVSGTAGGASLLGGLSVRYGTALSDSSGGCVEALLDGSDEPVRLRCEVPISEGDRVQVVCQGGAYVVVAVKQAYDAAEGARRIAAEAKEAIDEVSAWADGFKETADQIVYDQQLKDTIEEFSRTMSATYASTERLDERLKEYSTVEQTSEAIKATVTGEYVKGLVEGEYETPGGVDEKLKRYSTVEQTADKIASTVSAEYIEGKVGSTYATKTEVSQTASGLETKISAKVDAAGAVNAVSTMVRAIADGVEVGQVDSSGGHTTPYSLVSSAGAFEVLSAGGTPMFLASAGKTAKREHTWSPRSATDSAYTDDPTLSLLGVELLTYSDAGVTSGTVALSPGGYALDDFMFLELVFEDGSRQYVQRLYQPRLNKKTSLSRTVNDGAKFYVASATVALDTSAKTLTLSNNLEVIVSGAGGVEGGTADPLKLKRVLGWA